MVATSQKLAAHRREVAAARAIDHCTVTRGAPGKGGHTTTCAGT